MLIAALLVWLFRHPQPHITDENYRKIQPGMAQAEVEAILGGPPGDYANGRRQYYVQSCRGSTCDLFDNFKHGTRAVPPEKIECVSPGGKIAVWWGKEYAIGVEFGADGKVICAGIGWSPGEPGVVERIRAWLGL
jgi:hypothetical protein